MIRALLAAGAALAMSASASAALPTYGAPGTANPAVYDFTKASDGRLVAHFVGATAGLTNRLGVIAGGTDLGTGLSNRDPLGAAFDYGFVSAGTDLSFYIVTGEGNVFSTDASRNADGLNHVFSAAYAGGDTIGSATFAPGTYSYVGFEDLFGGGDLDFDDINFVFENTRVTETPAPAVAALFGIGAAALGLRRRQDRR